MNKIDGQVRLLQIVPRTADDDDRTADWTGTGERNEFTFQALTNLQQLTGQPPKIRVGANSEDHTVWSPTVTVRAASSF